MGCPLKEICTSNTCLGFGPKAEAACAFRGMATAKNTPVQCAIYGRMRTNSELTARQLDNIVFGFVVSLLIPQESV